MICAFTIVAEYPLRTANVTEIIPATGKLDMGLANMSRNPHVSAPVDTFNKERKLLQCAPLLPDFTRHGPEFGVSSSQKSLCLGSMVNFTASEVAPKSIHWPTFKT